MKDILRPVAVALAVTIVILAIKTASLFSEVQAYKINCKKSYNDMIAVQVQMGDLNTSEANILLKAEHKRIDKELSYIELLK